MAAEQGTTEKKDHGNKKHGYSHGPNRKIYNIWSAMKTRCQCPSSRAYNSYGGRGITVCTRWQSFTNFLRDMGPRPDGFQLERINNDDGYRPENCRWASRSEQARNRRSSVKIVAHGKQVLLLEYAEAHSLDPVTLYQRVRAGWAIETAVSLQKRPYRRSSAKPTSKPSDLSPARPTRPK
jgi:hypothetical protein